MQLPVTREDLLQSTKYHLISMSHISSDSWRASRTIGRVTCLLSPFSSRLWDFRPDYSDSSSQDVLHWDAILVRSKVQFLFNQLGQELKHTIIAVSKSDLNQNY